MLGHVDCLYLCIYGYYLSTYTALCWPTAKQGKTHSKTEKKTTLRIAQLVIHGTHKHFDTLIQIQILALTDTCAENTDIWPAQHTTVNQHNCQLLTQMCCQLSYEPANGLGKGGDQGRGARGVPVIGAPAQRVANWFVAHWLKGKLQVATCDSMRFWSRWLFSCICKIHTVTQIQLHTCSYFIYIFIF